MKNQIKGKSAFIKETEDQNEIFLQHKKSE